MFFLETRQLPLMEQREQAKKLNVNPVMAPDQGDLMSYLSGEKDSSDKIDTSKQLSRVVTNDSSKAMQAEEIQAPIMSDEQMEEHRSKFSRWLTSKRKSPYLLAHIPVEEKDIDLDKILNSIDEKIKNKF